MSDSAQLPASSEAPPLSPPPLPGVPTHSVSPLAAPSRGAEDAQNSSAASPLKRPRVAEPITHFLTPNALGGLSQSCNLVSPSPATLTAEQVRHDVHADTEAVSPKQARVESRSVTPRSPYSNLPRKIPRKTPVSSPTSSLTNSTLVTPPTAAAASHACTSAPSVSTAAKRITLHQRWAALLHGVFMKERPSSESDRVMDLCVRIVEAIPGDMEQTKDTFQTLLFNIKDSKNGELRRKVMEGELLVERLVTMDDLELANPELRKHIEEKIEERSKDTNLSEIRKAMRTSNSTLFKCRVCGARDSSWEQRQTRSGDEPMTVIITCNKCNTQWRKY
ncbi:transcription elongation factor, putative [Leishmania donovani]|uniref:Transcription elongation factor, putative n=1 Tax=Leishmania donovani TaxID=5661 RepID=E9BGN2_LEIDO|nr:transcription elongation factor, putative [Leishmania donovani]TPP52162.1 Transcription factor S-II (TFIIS), central domain family protein [Leishmania donovani]CBZ34408.1 transcription elongation factor, putative [Leishmania donovani]